MSSSDAERTEDPTPKALADARAKGDVLQSRDLGTALAIGGLLIWGHYAGRWLVDALGQQMSQGLRLDRSAIIDFMPMQHILHLIGAILAPLLALFGLMMVAAMIGPMLLGAWGFRAKAFAFQASRMNPANGLSRMVGVQGWTEMAKAVVKSAVLLIACGALLWAMRDRIAALGRSGVAAAVPDLAHMLVQLVMVVAIVMVGLALIDVPLIWWRRHRRLMMTRQQVRDEHKESEGAPEKKAAIRSRQHAILSRSARQAVAEATVVLMNPTHFAVALRYDPARDAAPMVMARGCDAMALAISSLARGSDVPLLVLPPLTRAIYFTSRIGQPIDPRLYMAVATVLAAVARLDAAFGKAQLPDIMVPPDLRFDADGRLGG